MKNGDFKRQALMNDVEKGKYPANEAARNALNYFYNRKPYQYTSVESKKGEANERSN